MQNTFWLNEIKNELLPITIVKRCRVVRECVHVKLSNGFMVIIHESEIVIE